MILIGQDSAEERLARDWCPAGLICCQLPALLMPHQGRESKGSCMLLFLRHFFPQWHLWEAHKLRILLLSHHPGLITLFLTCLFLRMLTKYGRVGVGSGMIFLSINSMWPLWNTFIFEEPLCWYPPLCEYKPVYLFIYCKITPFVALCHLLVIIYNPDKQKFSAL